MINNILERKNSIEQIFNQKVKELQELETYKTNLTTELLQLKGKLDLLNELTKEKTKEQSKSKK
jgi:hypothetical protein